MSRLIGELMGQPFILPIMLTGHIQRMDIESEVN